MNLPSDIIIYFVKLYVMCIYTYYCFKKISTIEKQNNIVILIMITSLVLGIICTCIKFYVSSFLSVIVLCFAYGSILGIITENKIAYSFIATIIAYAITIISFGISVIVEFFIYKLLHIDNNYLNLIIILVIQFEILYIFFKIKRFTSGFNFIYKKLNNDTADMIIINISIIVLLIYCLIGTNYDEITWSLVITFIILGLVTVLMIQKLLIMNYKKKLLEDTLKEHEEKLEEKDKEIEQLKDDKFNISKITHEFYNRQKALELLVEQNINEKSDITKENTSENILNMIKTLNDEYSKEFDKIKRLPKLETTGIIEIDTMFKYMQSECMKNNIEFKLKIIGNVYPLINNIIEKSRLETLIGDHVRDAINAVIATDTENKEILVILGVKDQKYELSIYDTGKEFGIKILSKLGLEATTTNSNKGGSGIGFLTTFDTMKETKASLIISEFPIEKEKYFTKSVTIRFDNKNEYKVCSYRASEIRKHKGNRNITIEKI